MRTLHVSLLAAVALLASPLAALADEGVQETWSRMHINGAPAGWVHGVTKQVPGDTPKVVTSSTSEMKMTRMGTTIEISSSSTSEETVDGKLLRIESRSKQSATVTEATYVFREGKLQITTNQMGMQRTVEQEVSPDLVGPAYIERETLSLLDTSGKSKSFKTYMADFQSVVTVTLTSGGREEITLHDGSTVQATRVETEMKTAGDMALPFKPVAWINADGEAVKSRIDIAGMTIETYLVGSEAEAKRADAPTTGPTSAPDVFEATLLREDDPIPTPRRLEAAWIRIGKKSEDARLPSLDGPGFTVSTEPDGSILVHAVRRVPPADKQGTHPLALAPAELIDALAASSMIQSDAEEIVAIAKREAGEGTTAWEAAVRLESWVYAHIKKKSMGVGFASALEVCRSGEGDCTEHAVLLAALCRAAGIPARVVMGIEYLAGIWGGHAWNEVWIDGAWFQLDATNALGFVDPLHLPFANLVMKEGGASEMTQMIGTLGTITVDIVEVQRDGRRIVVGDPAHVGTTEEGRWRNAVLGLSFAIPAGYELDPPNPRQGMSIRVMELDGTTSDGKSVEIEIDMTDAPARGGYDELLKPLGAAAGQVTTIEVDGREGRSLTRGTGSRTQRRTLVIADGALWIFNLDRAGGPEEDATYETFLASVDFDER
ncbi:MAG: transglutaminase family protein [Planctomycetota bacterium]